MISLSHCTCYCWKGPGHLRDGAGVSAILFVCSFVHCMRSNKLAGVLFVICVQFLPDSFISEVLSFPLLALIQIRAFSGVTTKRQSPESLLSHAKIMGAATRKGHAGPTGTRSSTFYPAGSVKQGGIVDDFVSEGRGNFHLLSVYYAG